MSFVTWNSMSRSIIVSDEQGNQVSVSLFDAPGFIKSVRALSLVCRAEILNRPPQTGVCPSCGAPMVTGGERNCSVDHVEHPNEDLSEMIPTFVCKTERCLAYRQGFWDRFGAWYPGEEREDD